MENGILQTVISVVAGGVGLKLLEHLYSFLTFRYRLKMSSNEAERDSTATAGDDFKLATEMAKELRVLQKEASELMQQIREQEMKRVEDARIISNLQIEISASQLQLKHIEIQVSQMTEQIRFYKEKCNCPEA